MTEEFRQELEEGLATIQLALSEEQMEKLYQFYIDLIETNKVMNLTAITQRREVIYKHFIDSLAIYSFCPEIFQGGRVIDVGTGAGFPGIPLAIAFPNTKFVLLDSLNKRIQFIRSVSQKLELKNLEAEHGRAEDFAKNLDYREQFDYCVSRAVANLSTLSEYCLPFVKVGGYFIPYKSGDIESEVDSAKFALKLLGGKLKEVHPFILAGEAAGRSFVVIKKCENTAKKYPRKAGMPAKEPLGK